LGYVMRKAGNHHASKARHHGKLPEKKERGESVSCRCAKQKLA
jgi:hypothetical protein